MGSSLKGQSDKLNSERECERERLGGAVGVDGRQCD